MTPLESRSSPYEARIAPSSRTVAALITMGLLPGASSLATMMLVAERRKRDSVSLSSPFGFNKV